MSNNPNLSFLSYTYRNSERITQQHSHFIIYFPSKVRLTSAATVACPECVVFATTGHCSASQHVANTVAQKGACPKQCVLLHYLSPPTLNPCNGQVPPTSPYPAREPKLASPPSLPVSLETTNGGGSDQWPRANVPVQAQVHSLSAEEALDHLDRERRLHDFYIEIFKVCSKSKPLVVDLFICHVFEVVCSGLGLI